MPTKLYCDIRRIVDFPANKDRLIPRVYPDFLDALAYADRVFKHRQHVYGIEREDGSILLSDAVRDQIFEHRAEIVGRGIPY